MINSAMIRLPVCVCKGCQPSRGRLGHYHPFLRCVFICHARARSRAFPSAVLSALLGFVIMQAECWLSNRATCKSAGSLTVTPQETAKARAVLLLPEWVTIDQTPKMQWSAVVATSMRNSHERPGGSLSSADKLLLTDRPASKCCRPTRLYIVINSGALLSQSPLKLNQM